MHARTMANWPSDWSFCGLSGGPPRLSNREKKGPSPEREVFFLLLVLFCESLYLPSADREWRATEVPRERALREECREEQPTSTAHSAHTSRGGRDGKKRGRLEAGWLWLLLRSLRTGALFPFRRRSCRLKEEEKKSSCCSSS